MKNILKLVKIIGNIILIFVVLFTLVWYSLNYNAIKETRRQLIEIDNRVNDIDYARSIRYLPSCFIPPVALGMELIGLAEYIADELTHLSYENKNQTELIHDNCNLDMRDVLNNMPDKFNYIKQTGVLKGIDETIKASKDGTNSEHIPAIIDESRIKLTNLLDRIAITSIILTIGLAEITRQIIIFLFRVTGLNKRFKRFIYRKLNQGKTLGKYT